MLKPSFKSPLFERFMTFQVFGAINSKAAEEARHQGRPLGDRVAEEQRHPLRRLPSHRPSAWSADVLEPNPNYWARDEVKNAGVRLRVVPDPDQRRLAA